MAWLVEQRDLVAGLSNGCPKMNQSNEDQKANLSNIAKRNQLKVESITDNEQSFVLSVSADEGNKFLKSIYQIVGDDESDIKQNKISINSPLAKALIGKEEGDVIEFESPGGIKSFEILKVDYI